MGKGTKEPAISTPLSHTDKAELLLLCYNARNTRKSIPISLYVSSIGNPFLPKMQLRFKECSLRYITLQQGKSTLGCNRLLMGSSMQEENFIREKRVPGKEKRTRKQSWKEMTSFPESPPGSLACP